MSDPYRRVLSGEISSKEYARLLKIEVRARRHSGRRFSPPRLSRKEDTWLIALFVGSLAAIVLIQWRLG